MQLLIARKGNVEIMEAPDPVPSENEVLIETAFSAISPGTELSALSRQSTSFLSLIRRGVHSWDKVKKSLARRGWRQTLAKVEEAVEKPVSIGYSLSGRVLQVGQVVDEFKVGDWVVAVGPGANHGTMACVPRLMCARLQKPERARDAAVAAPACVGIHAMHRAELSAGSEVGVFGLGVIGQFTVQVLRATGHRVIAFDPIESRRSDAVRSGAEAHDPAGFDFANGPALFLHGEGLDAVFLCAKSDSPEMMHQAAALCRRRGRVIIVGEFPIQLAREDAYEKELEVRISAAYGEGRYDPAYERLDQDYPVEHARWTVQRNLHLFLRWLEEGKIAPSHLHPQVVPFSQAASYYSKLMEAAPVLSLFEYSNLKVSTPSLQLTPRSIAGASAMPVAVVGTGRFATETHLPNLRHASDKFDLHTIVGRSPARTAHVATKFGAKHASCDLQKVLSDSSIKAILLVTPHALHARQTIDSLKAGKHVFVEKPLCLHMEELGEIQKICQSHAGNRMTPVLFAGYNRRYAPVSQKLAEQRSRDRKPVGIRYTFRVEPLPDGEWFDHPEQGGRFLGEVCHAVDWILWLVNSPIHRQSVIPDPKSGADIHLEFEDESRAHLHYQHVFRLNGPKEKIEVSWETTRWKIEDFMRLEIFERDCLQHSDTWSSKGHREILDAFAAAIAQPKGGGDPYQFLSNSRVILELDSLRMKSRK